MAATVSEYLVKSASFLNGSTKFMEKIRVLGDQYSSLTHFKTASVDFLNGLKNAEGNSLIRPLTPVEQQLLKSIQESIDDNLSIEGNFVKILTSNFIDKQLKMLGDISLDDLNSPPLLCAALKLRTPYELIKYNVYALATRSIVTSMGYLVQNLLLYSSADVYDGKGYNEGKNVKWDLVVERLDDIRSYIEVKSGPNDLDKGQVKSYRKEIQAVEKLGHKGYIGITYGKREANTVSINLFKQYLDKWEERTLIGTELWDFITKDDNYHMTLTNSIQQIADTILSQQSIIEKIENRVNALVEQFNSKYESIDAYLAKLW